MAAESGLVALLDALGTKGVWQRVKDPDEEVRRRREATAQISRHADDAANPPYWRFAFPSSIGGIPVDSTTFPTPTASFFSDTLVVFLETDLTYREQRLFFLGKLLSYLWWDALRDHRLLFRGVIAADRFFRDREVFIGPAVDEAASSERCAKWAGITLCPSAAAVVDEFVSRHQVDSPDVFERYPVPCVTGGPSMLWALNLYGSVREDPKPPNLLELLRRVPTDGDWAAEEKQRATIRFVSEMRERFLKRNRGKVDKSRYPPLS